MIQEIKYNDGGRKQAGYSSTAGDCVVRAIAIVTGKPYQTVYDDIEDASGYERNCRSKKSSPRNGVRKKTIRRYLGKLGYKWTPTMQIGSGCRVHLRGDELPAGRLIVSVSKHMVAVIDGVIHDTYDPSRGGTRCVYGYYQKK